MEESEDGTASLQCEGRGAGVTHVGKVAEVLLLYGCCMVAQNQFSSVEGITEVDESSLTTGQDSAQEAKALAPEGAPKCLTDVELRKFWSTFLNRSLVTGGLYRAWRGSLGVEGGHATKEF